MRKTFRSYYSPTEDEFSELWGNSLIIPDANVILNLYSYSPETKDAFIDIFTQVSDRLWIPHQAASEYQNRRLETIANQANAYGVIERELGEVQKKIGNILRTYSKHPSIHVEPLNEKIDNIISEIRRDLDHYKSQHPDLLNEDHIRDAISNLLDGKVGSAYSNERLQEIYKEGEIRYDKCVPPGYKDKKKGDTDQYGDLIIWLQIIDQATATHKPIIFITDDEKEDWWQEFSGNKIGPRRELIDEMFSKANVAFYMYQTDRFMEFAQKYLRPIDAEAIKEVRDIRKHNEKIKSMFEKTEVILNDINSEYISGEDSIYFGDKFSAEYLMRMKSYLKNKLLHQGYDISDEDFDRMMREYKFSEEELMRIIHGILDEEHKYHGHGISKEDLCCIWNTLMESSKYNNNCINKLDYAQPRRNISKEDPRYLLHYKHPMGPINQRPNPSEKGYRLSDAPTLLEEKLKAKEKSHINLCSLHNTEENPQRKSDDLYRNFRTRKSKEKRL